ncbi:MAG: D-hexose-6-phosphate mutarotase [Gemmatimonadaceae bacterium]
MSTTDAHDAGVTSAVDGAITLAHSSGSSASVTSYGAQVLSWIDVEGRERIYLSRRARSDGGAAIRGGIPVIFPQFGTGPLPKHGLLRTRRWSLVSHTESAASFRTTDDESTRALWPYPFLAELAVELTVELRVRLRITNTGDSRFTFVSALHNYFAVDSIDSARVVGLAGLTYIDKTAAGTRCLEESPALQIHSETDRIYIAGPREVAIASAIGSSSTSIEAHGFGDWVVWNPWRDATAALADMEPEDYRHMLCVEAARVTDPVGLEPGTTWVGEEVLTST